MSVSYERFVAEIGGSRASLQLSGTSELLRGVLEYNFSEKDSSWGLVTGSEDDGSVTLSYQYLSEGMVSTRPVQLQRTVDGVSGDGFTYRRSDDCSSRSWNNSTTSEVSVHTIHDPETGYYARVKFRIDGSSSGYRYRCWAEMSDDALTPVQSWIAMGATDASTAARGQSMQTNITPDQVDELGSATVACQTQLTP